MVNSKALPDLTEKVRREWYWSEIINRLNQVRLTPLTIRQQDYLKGVICNHSPQEVAAIYYVKAATVIKTLSRDIYPTIKQLYEEAPTDARIDKVTYQRVPQILAELGYRKEHGSQSLLPPRWSGLRDVTVFYGRTTELATLAQWVVEDQARVISLTGQGGIGKTTLGAKLGHHLQTQSDYRVFWRSLQGFPNPQDLLIDLLEFLQPEVSLEPTASLGRLLTRVMQHLTQQRLMIVLDDVHTILGNEASSRDDHLNRGYEDLLQAVMETPHASCLVLIGWETPSTTLYRSHRPHTAKYHRLKGLMHPDARQLIQAQNLPLNEAWDEVVLTYRGNPHALNLVVHEVKTTFKGNVEAFLDQYTLFLGDLKHLIHRQLKRITSVEKRVIQYLAASEKPKFRADIYQALSAEQTTRRSEVMRALNRLLQCSLIETIEDAENLPRFAVPPHITYYIQNELT